MNAPLLKMSKITKSFFGAAVLKNVSLEVAAGATLGLVGENGAGKSTLMNVLGGNLTADAGQMRFADKVYAPTSPRDAAHAGIAFIHQELNLFPNLSIAENVFLTRFPRRFLSIDRRQMERRTAALLEQVGLSMPAATKLQSLSSGERQMVEIAKALHSESRLIILDEPTTSLTERETERLFALLKDLKSRGIAMIYISHALGDVQRLSDSVTILRDGAVVAEGPIDQFDTRAMVSWMVGREVDQWFPPRTSLVSDQVALAVSKVTQPGVVSDISLRVHRGEVLGIAGLMGSGRTELARILFGLDPMQSGQIEIDGNRVEQLSTRMRIRQGMAMLTESRREDGLFMPASIRENLAIVAAPSYVSGYHSGLRRKPLESAIQTIARDVGLRGATDFDQPAQTLSGGNQQKVVLGKWLLNQPHVLILDEPTRGIDVGAKYDLYRLIDQLAAAGSGVLVISSEIEELIGICDRIVVMGQGELKDELPRDQFDRQRILHAALHADSQTGEAE